MDFCISPKLDIRTRKWGRAVPPGPRRPFGDLWRFAQVARTLFVEFSKWVKTFFGEVLRFRIKTDFCISPKVDIRTRKWARAVPPGPRRPFRDLWRFAQVARTLFVEFPNWVQMFSGEVNSRKFQLKSWMFWTPKPQFLMLHHLKTVTFLSAPQARRNLKSQNGNLLFFWNVCYSCRG